jgi:hypothetical protein
MTGSSAWSWINFPRCLFIHNPLYLISALFILIGLHKSLGSDVSATGGWLLMGLLCGYTLLLAIAGWVIVRFGRVWEDARTILLVLLLMFVALSVSFDKQLLDNPLTNSRFLVVGLIFSITVSEGVFRSLRIGFPVEYRLPYYLLLTLLFGYPLCLGQLSITGRDAAMSMGVFLFPAFAALTLLTLIPAARLLGERSRPTGTPWSWPWFPWSIFAFILLAVVLRCYSLSMAFESAKGPHVSFQAYFVLPLVLAVSVLMLEGGIVHGRASLNRWAMLLPLTSLLVCLPGTKINPVADSFLDLLCNTVGSPAQLTIYGVGAFYAIAWWRRQPLGELGAMACLAAASWIDADTLSLSTLAKFNPWPMLALAAIQLTLGLQLWNSRRVMVGIAAAVVASTGFELPVAVQTNSAYVLIHGTVLLLLLTAALFDDVSTRYFRGIASVGIACSAVIATTAYEWIFPEVPTAWHAFYSVGLSVVAAIYWYHSANVGSTSALLVTWTALAFLGSKYAYRSLAESPLEKGLPWLAGGLALLALALLLSFAKGGYLGHLWRMALRSTRAPR